ncbi:DUF924 family protein [Plastorhodobacter daqingensis]|uniref:DUF924 family protein n=1 Tax=Plastorhodobacter daqingensis TaxID=1387281 RepID=A0ABW2UME7_9RHOB
MPETAAILDFWLKDVGPKGWYESSEALDDEIRQRFLPHWEQARRGAPDRGACSAEGVLAYIILTDQFPRNMFREDPRAFATDQLARRAAQRAIHMRWDLRVAEPARQFFYLPLMHSEILADQERCVRLVLTRMPETGAETLVHARAHRGIIRRFGRFPYRNAALGRSSTPEEEAFLAQGGYRAAVSALQAEAAE